MKTLRFFKCRICGNVVVKLIDKGVPIFCCGEMMEEVVANTVEASTEKHLPITSVENGVATVKIGSVAHPMEEGHYINFVVVQTDKNFVIATLNPGDKPEAKLYVGKNKIKAVYEYCNLHGLWKA